MNTLMMRMERCGSNVKTQEGKIMTKFNITRYKGRVIYTKKLGKEFQAYQPFGDNSEIAKTKKMAIEGVKKNIDEKESVETRRKSTAQRLRFKDKKLFYYKVVKENVNRG